MKPESLPTRQFETLFHVGTLNAADKGRQGRSLEGTGLSVSECPEAWRHIAKLGGLPLWELRRCNNQFLDYHALSPAQRTLITEWALAEGLAQRITAWERSWEDGESGEIYIALYQTRYDAEKEAEEGEAIRAVPALRSTEKLDAYAGYELELLQVFDFLVLAYAEHLDFDGVFWADTLAVYALSAPRAVIFKDKLTAWHRECLAQEKCHGR